jgi:hypothetical protein
MALITRTSFPSTICRSTNRAAAAAPDEAGRGRTLSDRCTSRPRLAGRAERLIGVVVGGLRRCPCAQPRRHSRPPSAQPMGKPWPGLFEGPGLAIRDERPRRVDPMLEFGSGCRRTARASLGAGRLSMSGPMEPNGALSMDDAAAVVVGQANEGRAARRSAVAPDVVAAERTVSSLCEIIMRALADRGSQPDGAQRRPRGFLRRWFVARCARAAWSCCAAGATERYIVSQGKARSTAPVIAPRSSASSARRCRR